MILIKCPDCSTDNDIQKFCGNCGAKLLAEGAEINKDEKNPSLKKITKTRWFIGILISLSVWILGGTILSFAVGIAGYDEKYAPAICFVIGILIMVEYVRTGKEINEDENE